MILDRRMLLRERSRLPPAYRLAGSFPTSAENIGLALGCLPAEPHLRSLELPLAFAGVLPTETQLIAIDMSAAVPRAAKRLRLTSSRNWTCSECRRSLVSSVRQRQQQQPPSQDEKTTHFGFETISESMKASKGTFSIGHIPAGMLT